MKVRNGTRAKGSGQVVVVVETTGSRRISMAATGKPFNIDKKQVLEAFKAVKSNGGAAGVDGQTLEHFEADLKYNLYKIWNGMSSGTYFPPPVRAVSIPKKSGGQRILGVPTVGDCVAQMVVKRAIEPILDPVFLPDSYGYRPGKSALDAVGSLDSVVGAFQGLERVEFLNKSRLVSRASVPCTYVRATMRSRRVD
jgi:RNA-directed DNA polymerase